MTHKDAKNQDASPGSLYMTANVEKISMESDPSGSSLDIKTEVPAVPAKVQVTEPVTMRGSLPSDLLNMQQMYDVIREAGKNKVLKPFSHTLTHSLLAGWYVGFGTLLACFMAGNIGIPAASEWHAFVRLFYAFSFPVGLILIVLLGGELFTGNCVVSTIAWLEGDCNFLRYMGSLTFSWFGNLAGCLIFCQLIKKTNLMEDYPLFKSFMIRLAEKKVTLLTWEQVYVRGIMGNWLVDLAILLGAVSTSYVGKTIGCFVPIFCFAALGFEHCIANQIMLPLGMIAGANFTAEEAVRYNFVASTLGNFTGGAIFVGIPYYFLYGKYSKQINKWTTF